MITKIPAIATAACAFALLTAFAAGPAGAGSTPPLGPNLLQNPNFSAPFATDPSKGWCIGGALQGAKASIADSGIGNQKCLRLEQTIPVTIAPESFNLPDYGDFMKSMNGGKGGGFVIVTQHVPVTPGKSYHLRFRYRASDMAQEVNQPGPNRGFVSFMVWIFWEGTTKDREKNLWVANNQQPSADWSVVTDGRFPPNGDPVPAPYVAPQGSEYADLRIQLVVNAASKKPVVDISDIEFVEVP